MSLPNTAAYIEFIMMIGLIIVGLSHIIRPQMWVDYFNNLHTQGHSGVITRTFIFELWPAIVIVSFHQVWEGVGVVLTIYGHLLLIKCALSMLFPDIGMRSLSMSGKGNKKSLVGAGIGLLLIGGTCAWSLTFP